MLSRVLRSLFDVCLGMYVRTDKRNVRSKSYVLFDKLSHELLERIWVYFAMRCEVNA
jgi:hypothetical protein